jgi:CubicO group peptidase (beta-lactamase class C family)
LLAAACTRPAPHTPLPPLDPHDIPANVDRIVGEALAESGTPSASVAVVQDGRILYVHAYGDGRIEPKTAATSGMRYGIGSISKQFTASALLLLAEDGKVSLDDKVGKYLPGLTRGDDVTIREILSHTSGYSDYAPQDYMIPDWRTPVAPQAILDHWAKQPLDFEPGTQWQYSNTNYVIAGQIVEAISKQTLAQFLHDRIFGKLGMTTVTTDAILPAKDAQGVYRRAKGPLRVVEPMAQGWMYAAGDLSMTAEDLAKWDISLIAGTILSPASTAKLETEVQLANGAGTGYALGLDIALHDGKRQLRHGGEVVGFIADNLVMPDDKLAVVVLTNQDASGTAPLISTKIRNALLRAQLAPSVDADRRVRAVLEAFAHGKINTALFTANAQSYFTAAAIQDYATSLAPLGELLSVDETRSIGRGGFIFRAYTAKYASGSVEVSVYETLDGKLEQFLLTVE